METSVSFFCIACFFLLSYALGSALGRPRRLGIPPERSEVLLVAKLSHFVF